jgi:hypothetical protein
VLCTTFHAQTRVTVGGARLRRLSSAGFTASLPRIAAMSTPAPAALLAFLRGLERRARTLATAQCGDPVRADRIWADTAAAFPAEAADLPVAAWPVRFWARLLAHPAMAVAVVADSPLAALGPGPRAALLLRLVAGLDPRPAAEVLGVSEHTYRYALQRGLEQARAAGIDADGLRELRASWQRQPLPSSPGPVDFTAAPATEPVAVHAPAEPVVAVPRAVPAEAPAVAAPRRYRPAIVGTLAVALVGAIVAWRWLVPDPAPAPTDRPTAILDTPAPSPAALSPVTHPDYALLAEPDDAALAAELDLLSWLAAEGDAALATPASVAPPAAGAAP